jgi:hypothetical protein
MCGIGTKIFKTIIFIFKKYTLKKKLGPKGNHKLIASSYSIIMKLELFFGRTRPIIGFLVPFMCKNQNYSNFIFLITHH